MAGMTKIVIARSADSVARIAEAEGHFPATIWDHPDNRALREARTSMNVLAEGDRVAVPPIVPKEVECGTDARHRFRRRGVPARLRLQLNRDGVPRVGVQFRLEVAGATTEGQSDGRGIIEAWVSPRASRALLWLDGAAAAIELLIGALDPVTTLRGVQQRLLNLGYECPVHGELDPLTRAALQAFQRHADLEPSGELDPPTREKLLAEHDRME